VRCVTDLEPILKGAAFSCNMPLIRRTMSYHTIRYIPRDRAPPQIRDPRRKDWPICTDVLIECISAARSNCGIDITICNNVAEFFVEKCKEFPDLYRQHDYGLSGACARLIRHSRSLDRESTNRSSTANDYAAIIRPLINRMFADNNYNFKYAFMIAACNVIVADAFLIVLIENQHMMDPLSYVDAYISACGGGDIEAIASIKTLIEYEHYEQCIIKGFPAACIRGDINVINYLLEELLGHYKEWTRIVLIDSLAQAQHMRVFDRLCEVLNEHSIEWKDNWHEYTIAMIFNSECKNSDAMHIFERAVAMQKIQDPMLNSPKTVALFKAAFQGACKIGNLAVVKFVVELLREIEPVRNDRRHYTFWGLFHACVHGHVGVVSYLLSVLPINKETILAAIASAEHFYYIDVMELLYERAANCDK
jgi:hypothetical protein